MSAGHVCTGGWGTWRVLGPLLASIAILSACATELDRGDLAVEYFNLANGYLELERYDPAVLYYERALALVPDNLEARYNLAFTLIQAGQPAAAVPHLELLLAADANNVPALELSALADHRQGSLSAALATYERILTLAPEHQVARFNTAVLQWALGEREVAATSLRNLLRRNPEDQGARYHLGLLLLELGAAEEAVEELGQYLEATPDDADALMALARAQTLRERYGDALGAYDAAVAALPERDPRLREIGFARGTILLTEVEDPNAGLAALEGAFEAGFRDRERVAQLLADGRLLVYEQVLALASEHNLEPPPEPEAADDAAGSSPVNAPANSGGVAATDSQ